MKSTLIAGGMLAFALSGPAFAASTAMSAPPANAVSVSMYYKATVYDPKENTIGEVDDVLLDKSGKVTGLVIGVGGFLGIGEKDVIVPFDAIKVMHRDHTASTTRTAAPPAPAATANPPAANAPGTAAPAGTAMNNNANNTAATHTATTAKRDNSDSWLAIDETKDTLKAAPGFSYDRTTMTWKPAK